MSPATAAVPKGVKVTTSSSIHFERTHRIARGVCYQRGWRSVLMTHMEVLTAMCVM